MKTSPEIPKIIHYCWFGGNQLPPLAEKCIESWKKYLPEYEIKRWDESNFDVNIIPYTQQAYEVRKYAFVSDYARFWILYKYGGIYFDTDVEVIKPLTNIIAKGPFMGCQNPAIRDVQPSEFKISSSIKLGVNPGLGLGVNPGSDLIKELLDVYATLQFKNANGSLNTKTIVSYTSELLSKKGLKNTPNIQCIEGIYIYPVDFFSPMDYKTGQLNVTANTLSIHHYAKTWHGKKEFLFSFVARLLGKKSAKLCSQMWKKIHSILSHQ